MTPNQRINKMKEETEAQQTIKWFKQSMDCEAYENDGDVFIEVGDGFSVMISASEISYRAELWKEYQEGN